jgi:signal transduction histidine kinase
MLWMMSRHIGNRSAKAQRRIDEFLNADRRKGELLATLADELRNPLG